MKRPIALVYRSSATEGDDDLSEPVAKLLHRTPYNFHTIFIGPDEDRDLSDGLDDAVLLAFPGGTDLDEAYDEIKSSRRLIREFVQAGGRYLGICLGAYLAGHSPGLGLLPKGADTDSECERRDAQVRTDEDAVIQVDWKFASGARTGELARDQWMYFQEGPFVEGLNEDEETFVLGRYSKSGRVAASVNRFGKGWVGVIGPHPEADQTWFEEYDLPTPQGLRYDIGIDLITALMEGGVGTSQSDHQHAIPSSQHVQTSTSTRMQHKLGNAFEAISGALH